MPASRTSSNSVLTFSQHSSAVSERAMVTSSRASVVRSIRVQVRAGNDLKPNRLASILVLVIAQQVDVVHGRPQGQRLLFGAIEPQSPGNPAYHLRWFGDQILPLHDKIAIVPGEIIVQIGLEKAHQAAKELEIRELVKAVAQPDVVLAL